MVFASLIGARPAFIAAPFRRVTTALRPNGPSCCDSRTGSRRRPQGQEFGGPGAQLGQPFGVKGVPDGQVQPPELLADRELGRVLVAVGGQDACAIQSL